METTGLIIKTTDYGEGSRIVTVLTPEGKIQAVANGARSLKSHLFAGSQLFCYNSIVLQKGKGALPYLKSCDILENFYHLRMDVVKVSMCAYFCELLDLMVLGGDCEDVLRLALNTLFMVERMENFKYIKPVFELRLLMLLGFMPCMDSCVRCGSEKGLTRFSTSDGGVVCTACEGGVHLQKSTFDAMNYIINSEDNKLYAFNLSKPVEKELWEVCEEQILYNLEYKPKKLSYLYSIM